MAPSLVDSYTHTLHSSLKLLFLYVGGGGASAAISLDHFFHSLKQYYFSLSRDSAHKATPTGCAITPQELEGLKNVLRIIQTIAKHVCWPIFQRSPLTSYNSVLL